MKILRIFYFHVESGGRSYGKRRCRWMSSVFENSLSECEINPILYELQMCKVSLKNVFIKAWKQLGIMWARSLARINYVYIYTIWRNYIVRTWNFHNSKTSGLEKAKIAMSPVNSFSSFFSLHTGAYRKLHYSIFLSIDFLYNGVILQFRATLTHIDLFSLRYWTVYVHLI